jgi:RNA polymerase sigma factor (sigma-70 family)
MHAPDEVLQGNEDRLSLRSFESILYNKVIELSYDVIKGNNLDHYRDDAVQVTCIRLLQMPILFFSDMYQKSSKDLEAYLRRAIWNNYLQILRTDKHLVRVGLKELRRPAYDVDDPTVTVEDDDFRSYARQVVDKALDTLSAYEKAVWVLRKRVGWPYSRIAKRLRTRNFERRKAATIRKTFHMAERKIGTFLKNEILPFETI